MSAARRGWRRLAAERGRWRVRGLGAAARALVLAACAFAAPLSGQDAPERPELSNAVRQFVAVDTAVLALTNVRVIDGTGAPAREGQTVVVREGMIAAMGPVGSVAIPAGAQVMDLAGRSLIPGLVMVHEHLYYPTGGGTYANLSESFVRLYLAGGVTAMRTGGNMNGYGEIGVARQIAEGRKAGPWIDATAPYVEMGGSFAQMAVIETPEDARRHVAYWADQGATSVKAYMNVSRAVLGAAIDEAHDRGMLVTGHLCSVTYAEAAELGIDDLEHGFFAATDFVTDKAPDACPGQGAGQATIDELTPDDPRFRALVAKLIEEEVAVTSTLTIFETFTPGRPLPPGLEVLTPELREQYEQRHAATARQQGSRYATLFPRAAALEVAFARAGGLLVAGTDPTGGGGVVPGYSNQRALELLVESGFTPLEAIRIGTLNGAVHMGIERRVGSIEVGKQADLVVVAGNPAANIGDVRNVQMVFKQGVGYDPARLIESVRGRVGLW